jgi:hypothetical protein
MTPNAEFLEALTTFETQVVEATKFWFAASAMNECAKLNPDTLKAINLTAGFWLTVKLALEQQAILAVGKIFGAGERTTKNMNSFLRVLEKSRLTVFSKEALAERETRMPRGVEVDRAHVPTTEDIRRLGRLVRRHRRTYETQFKQIRDEHIAHTEIIDPAAQWAMFQKTRIKDLEKLIAFLNQFQVAVRGMYEQGRAAKLRPMRWSVRSLAKRKLKDLSQNVSQEDIVAEAKICMALLTHGANALPRASRRSLRWV